MPRLARWRIVLLVVHATVILNQRLVKLVDAAARQAVQAVRCGRVRAEPGKLLRVVVRLHHHIDAQVRIAREHLAVRRLARAEGLVHAGNAVPQIPAQLVANQQVIHRAGDEDELVRPPEQGHLLLRLARAVRMPGEFHLDAVLGPHPQARIAALVRARIGRQPRFARRADRHLHRDVLVRPQRLLRSERYDRQPGEHQGRIAVRVVRVGQDLIRPAVADRIGAPVVGVVVHKAERNAPRARRGQVELRPLLPVIKAQRAVKRVAFRVIAQRLSVVFKRRHQRRIALLACVLNGPDVLDVPARLHHRRVGGGKQHRCRRRTQQRGHAQQETQPCKSLHSGVASPFVSVPM